MSYISIFILNVSLSICLLTHFRFYLILINVHDTSVDKELLGISYQRSLVFSKCLSKWKSQQIFLLDFKHVTLMQHLHLECLQATFSSVDCTKMSWLVTDSKMLDIFLLEISYHIL